MVSLNIQVQQITRLKSACGETIYNKIIMIYSKRLSRLKPLTLSIEILPL